MTPREALDRGVSELSIAMPDGATDRLVAYLDLLGKWNRTYNLTAIREPLTMVSHHLLDSLAVLPHLPMPEHSASLADAGSGAGLPGIPLALARPGWRVALAEASQKKAAFLRQAVIELRLANVEVYEGRVESWKPAERFAIVISRAFAQLSDFLAACRHLVAPGGRLAAMKGQRPDDAGPCSVIRLRVPSLEAERHLVLCSA